MADIEVTLGSVLYYAKQGCYRHMQLAMTDLLARFGSDPVLLFWRAFGMILEERIVEGMRELRALLDSPDLILAAPLLLIHAHRQCKTVDKEAVQKLEADVKTNRRSCTDKALYYASIVFWLTGRADKARDHLERCMKSSPSAQALAIMGWVNMTSGKEDYVKNSIKYFDESCKGSTPPIIGVLGKARYHTLCYQYIQAVELLNNALVSTPSSLPLFLEKMRVQLALQEWDVAIETAQRCLLLDSNCIEATQVMALEQCIRHGNMNKVASILGQLIEQLDIAEPRSHRLYLLSGRAFSRLSGGHPLVLQQTLTLIERALSLCPSSPTHTVEQGYQYLLSGDIQQAVSVYKKALSMSDSNMPALIGTIHCKLILGKTREAEQQLEFLNELQGSAKTSEVLFLNALTMHQKGRGRQEQMIQEIRKATKVHFAAVKGYPLGLEYFYLLNPAFIIDMGELLMKYAPSEPPSLMGKTSSLLQEVMTTVSPLAHAAPGLLHVQLLLARVQYLSGNADRALSLAQLCVDGNHCVISALLLQAVIHLQKSNQQQCGQILETALSTDFEVQRYPLYLLIKGQQQYTAGLFKESTVTLQSAIDLKKLSSSTSKAALLSPPTVSQWVTGHLSLAQSLSKTGQQHEATKIMQDCITEFAGTPEEARVTIANAELSLSRGNSKEALEMLSRITEDKPYYIQAKERMAEIYLKHERNKQQYIQCYRDIADKLPGPPTAQLLGDALITVHEPEQALAVFEKALKKTPSDGILASKVGNAYVKMHNFNKAISYYEASLKSIDHPSLKCDLALLYARLQRYEQAERILLQALVTKQQREEDEERLQSLRDNVRYCQLLTKVYKKTKRFSEAVGALEKARGYQTQLVKTVSSEEPDSLRAEKETLANVVHQLAKELSNDDSQNSPKAEHYYKEAVGLCPDIAIYRESLAHWYLSNSYLEQCEQECVTLLQIDSSNDVATAILAELIFVRGDITGAIKHFEDFLIRKPTNYKGLARFIDLLRRGGNLEQSVSFLESAESSSTHPDYEAGLKYCRGLYCWYKGEFEEALHHFNHARHDSEWGEKALFNMIEVCLHSEYIIGCETLKSSESDSSLSGSDKKRFESDLIAARTAEKLLREIRPQSSASTLKVKVLENYILLVGQSKQNAEKALEKFNEIPQHDREAIPCLVAMAMAYLIVKQVPRARNLLKRLGKMPWVAQYAEELEKGWILLADVYIQSGKYDLAVEQLKKCLKYNKSCSKAYEYLGFIAEKEQAYEDAAKYYSSAWINGHMTNPAVGYRLAFNRLKGQDYLSAIDVCHEVLGKYPNYPRIRGEILEKARQSVRI